MTFYSENEFFNYIMEKKLDSEFWSNRWKEGQTGWDVGEVSAPFIPFFESLSDRSIRILIPGCGNGYEGEYLWKNGFHNVHILDISDWPLANFQKRVPDFRSEQLICADFFSLNEKFDLVIEQTFFCALDPSLRRKYVEQMHQIIQPGGMLAGLMFNFPLTDEGPPFGGSIAEYKRLFSGKFEIIQLDEARNSIKPRLGRELWVELKRI